MSRTQSDRSTQSRDMSTQNQQLPLRGPGLNVHDAHDQVDQQQHESDLRSDLRAALVKKIESYPSLKVDPPYDDEKWVGAQCARWANRHPVTRDYSESEQLSSYAYNVANNKYLHGYDSFICKIDQAYLAKKLGVSVRTVQRINRRFVEFDVITIKRRCCPETKKTMNFYVLPG